MNTDDDYYYEKRKLYYASQYPSYSGKVTTTTGKSCCYRRNGCCISYHHHFAMTFHSVLVLVVLLAFSIFMSRYSKQIASQQMTTCIVEDIRCIAFTMVPYKWTINGTNYAYNASYCTTTAVDLSRVLPDGSISNTTLAFNNPSCSAGNFSNAIFMRTCNGTASSYQVGASIPCAYDKSKPATILPPTLKPMSLMTKWTIGVFGSLFLIVLSKLACLIYEGLRKRCGSGNNSIERNPYLDLSSLRGDGSRNSSKVSTLNQALDTLKDDFFNDNEPISDRSHYRSSSSNAEESADESYYVSPSSPSYYNTTSNPSNTVTQTMY
jgi:hypothetical protein